MDASVSTVVCGVDDSDGARRAAKVAAELSERLGARLVLAHVAPPPTIPGASVVPHAQEELLHREYAAAEKLLGTFAGEAHELRVAYGDPADALADVAREEGAALLVVGSRGRGGFASAVLGSVSNELASHAPCPVVVVPPTTGD